MYVSQTFKHPVLNEKTIPKIKYESSSDSSEEENVKKLQGQYLNLDKKLNRKK